LHVSVKNPFNQFRPSRQGGRDFFLHLSDRAAVLEEVERFGAGAQSDDLTMLVLRSLPDRQTPQVRKGKLDPSGQTVMDE